MDEQTKERLIAELRDYLDTRPSDESDDGDATADSREVDLYTLFTELAGLRNEIRLESRQVKRALDEFNNVFTTLEASNQRLQGELDTARGQQADTSASAQRPILLALIGLRDRIAQARQLAAAHRPNPFARLVARREQAVIHDLAEGLGITLRRVDQSLASCNVTAIETIGQPVEPHTMRVAATRADSEKPDGVVLEEAERGYRRADEILILAEVVVNKRSEQPS